MSESTASQNAAHLRHELRTPLNHIIGYSEMLMEEVSDRGQEDLLPDLKRINDAARTLQSLIERHVVSAPELGDKTVPLAAAEEAAAEEVRRQIAAVRQSQDERREDVFTDATLLVVDDSEENRDMLSRRLIDRGYTVLSAAGGHEALAIVEKEDLDLILLDVMMPDISGLEVLRTLRRQYAVADLPVIMVTAMDRSDDTVTALQLGANDYVTKPLDFQVVLARTETQLQLRRAKQRIDQLALDLEAKNAFIRATFDRYVSADIAADLLERAKDPKLSGEKRTITIMLADLRGFTTMVSQLEPEQVVRLLNNFLGAMTDVIHEHGGTIDEFIGDAVLALFGAPLQRPDDALRAVACAVQMQIAMDSVNRLNARSGLPTIEMGIGICSGEVIVGSVGSLVRAKYTAVGSSVNLAARIESCTVGRQVIISRSTLDLAGAAVVVEGPTLIEAKGFRDPIELFDVCSVGAPYDLVMPATSVDLEPLERPIVVECSILEGKHHDGSRFSGEFLRLGQAGAEMRTDRPLPTLLDMQIHVFDGRGQEINGDLYVKVTRSLGDGVVLIRFTGIHRRVQEFLDSRIATKIDPGVLPLLAE